MVEVRGARLDRTPPQPDANGPRIEEVSMKRALLLLVASCLVLLALPVAALATPTFDQAVDTLVQEGYPQRLTDHICGLGTSPMGFRFGGSFSDNQAARSIAKEMRRIGLVNVHLERVPADVFTFHWARLKAGGMTFPATTFGGLKKSPSMGATGELVYVGLGTKAEFDAAGDVTGKVVLVDFASSYWWLNWPFHEAQFRGAKAVVFTTSPVDLSYYSLPETYGSNDSEASWSIPGIYVNRVTGDWLKEKLAEGSFRVTVRNHVVLKRAEKGGVGYNVVGTWPGSDPDAKKILFGAHHDAYFTGAIDNTTGCVGELTIAKALKMSGYTPRNTLKFVAFTHEEWGAVDSYYDFLMGSYRAITGRHAGWAGSVAGMINLEGLGCPQGQTRLYSNPELAPWMQKIVDAHPELMGPTLPNVVSPWANAYTDQWPLTAKGVPSITYIPKPRPLWYPIYYHSSEDRPDTVDWDFFAKGAKLMQRFMVGLDAGVLPYDLRARATEIAGLTSPTALNAAKVDAALNTRVQNAVSAFSTAAANLEARRASFAPADTNAINTQLVDIEKALCGNLTALDWWDGTTIPHAQVLWDLQGVQAALTALAKTPADTAAALDALDGVGYTYYGKEFSREVFLLEQERHDPSYERIFWGGLGHLPQPIDVMPAYDVIGAGGDMTPAVAMLTAIETQKRAELQARLADLAGLLEVVTPQIDAVH